MNAIPPFIANSPDDVHCVNAVFRMVFKQYLNQEFTWEEIDKLTKVIPGKGIWSVPGDILLAKRGITVRNIEPIDYDRLYSEGPQYLNEVVGEKAATYYFERSNIAEIIPLIPEFQKYVQHETRRATIEEVLGYLKEGKLVAAEVDSGTLNDTTNFALHLVLLYDFDGTHIHLHDPGLPPMPSRTITLEKFNSCWAYPGSNGGIEVFAKNNK